MALCRSRSSTTSSAPARPAASRSTAIARCASCSISSAPARSALPPRQRGPRRQLHRILRRRSRRAAARRAAGGPRLPPCRAASLQGGDAMVPRVTSISWSTARRRASPIPSSRARLGGLRARARRRGCGRTFQRATLLLDAPFHQAVAPGELDIPAVRGVGGSLLYFLDQTSALGRVWDIEFEHRPADRRRTRPASPRSTMSRNRCSTRRC